MLVLASLTVLTLDYHGEANRAITHVRHGIAEVFFPVQRGIASALHPIGDVVSGMFHYGGVSAQNDQLRREIGRLSQQLAESNAAALSARQLYALDNLRFVENIPLVAAQVISSPSSNFEVTIEINRGTSSGIGNGMPVLGDNGLIGKVLSASSNTATVLLINDRRSSIGVRISNDGVFDASGGGASEPLSLSQIGPSPTPRVGARAVTAGDLAYPADIPVGTVSAVHTSNAGLFASASLRPLVNLRDLTFVSVMLWLTPA